MYVLKVPEAAPVVKSYYVDMNNGKLRIQIIYTEDYNKALQFDDIEEAAFHHLFLVSNTDVEFCIAEAQVHYKDL